MNEYRGTHLDLFSGIGGFALAAKWAGFQTIGFSEVDQFCCRLLAKRFPGVTNYGDIRKLRGVPCDLITGGFPCQPFSLAGKRRGAADDRYLWPEMFRVIAESEPAWVLAENVPGIIGMELETVLSDLESIGYEVGPPLVIPACAVDAPHRRMRVWIVAYHHSKSGWPGRSERSQTGQEATHCGHVAHTERDRRRGAGQPGGQQEARSGSCNEPARTNCGPENVAYAMCQGGRKDSCGSLENEAQNEGWPAEYNHILASGRKNVADTSSPSTDRHAIRENASHALPGVGSNEDVSNAESDLRSTPGHDRAETSDGRSDAADSRRGHGQGQGNKKQQNAQPLVWLPKPDVGGDFDGLSSQLDGIGGLDETTKKRAGEILRDVWSETFSEAIQWTLGRFVGLSAKEILLSFLCEYVERTHGGQFTVESGTITEASLREVWRTCESARSPYRRQYKQQLAREFADALRELSRQAPSLYPQAWDGDCWENGVTRLATGIPNRRLGRLKGLGNSIVPQVAAEIMKAMASLSR